MKLIDTNPPPKNELIRLWYIDDQGFMRHADALFDEAAGPEDDNSIYDENDNLIGTAIYWSSVKEELMNSEELTKEFLNDD